MAEQARKTPAQRRAEQAEPDAAAARKRGYTIQQYEPGKWRYWHPGKIAQGVGWATEHEAWLAAGRSWRSNYSGGR